jgi:hypothetical protein
MEKKQHPITPPLQNSRTPISVGIITISDRAAAEQRGNFVGD